MATKKKSNKDLFVALNEDLCVVDEGVFGSLKEITQYASERVEEGCLAEVTIYKLVPVCRLRQAGVTIEQL